MGAACRPDAPFPGERHAGAVFTKSFKAATVKEILTWYAATVPVVYQAEGSDKLAVLVTAKGMRDGD